MLSEMRVLSQNWIGRSILAVVLGFIIISFSVWGIGDRFTNFHASDLAKVGSERISVQQFRTLYQNQIRQLEQKQKRNITNEEARRAGLDRQILARLVNDATLDQEAARLGLAVSDDSIRQAIMKDKMFQGPTGQFDRMRFAGILNENGLTEPRYVRDQRELIMRQGLGEAVIAGLDMPKTLQSEIYRFQSEVRDIEFFVLPESAIGNIGAPSDADLKTYYDQHSSRYQAPEYRKITVLSVVPADLAKAVTEDAIKKRYEEAKASHRFVVPEKRTVERLSFADAKSAEAAKAKIDGGMSFAKLAAEQKKTPADIGLGTVAKSELIDPTIADAAFALPEGGTGAPLKTPFGVVLVHVGKVAPAHEQPLAEVSGTLRDEIAKERAAQIHEKVDQERTAGKTLKEAAADVGLKPRAIDAIDAQGRDPSGKPIEGIVEGPAVLKGAFSSDVGSDTDSLSTAGGGYAWFEVNGIDASHLRPLANVKADVEAAWRNDELDKRLAAEGDKLAAAIDGGKTIEAAAATIGKPQIMKGTNISRHGGTSLAPSVVRALFSVNVGKAGSAPGFNRKRIVFKITAARVPPESKDDEEFRALMTQLGSSFESDVLDQYVTQLQHEIGVGINPQALKSALGGEDAGS